MKREDAVGKMSEVMRRKHLARSTEQSYCGWLRRYCDWMKTVPSHWPSEQKLEQFLTTLAKDNVAASTQNQAFNALVFFYNEVLGVKLADVRGLRARRSQRLRRAPGRAETFALLKAVQARGDAAVSLAVRLLYGCGLRVTEALSLRIKDVDLAQPQLIIREAKGGKDRVVGIPCAVAEDLREQMEAARMVWKRDRSNGVPVALPHQLAKKFPSAQFDWNWAWLFPAYRPALEARTGKVVRSRLHEANVQRAVREASRQSGAMILPHELRHAYATHCLNRGVNPRALQEVMGHKSLETTMGYLHAEALSVASPLDG